MIIKCEYVLRKEDQIKKNNRYCFLLKNLPYLVIFEMA